MSGGEAVGTVFQIGSIHIAHSIVGHMGNHADTGTLLLGRHPPPRP